VLALSLELTRYQLASSPAPLPVSVGASVGLLVLLVFVLEGIWRLARHISVIAHEGAHALAGLIMGRRIVSVKLNDNATGETVSLGPQAGLSSIVFLFAGYLGPSLFGLGAAVLLAHNQVHAVLVVTGIALFIMLLLVRNFFGVISVLFNGGIVVLVLWYGSAELQIIAAYALSWFLLLSGVRFAVVHGSKAADAAALRTITRIPRVAWALLWLAGSVSALWVGGHLLV
jgi:hypothetical protein